MSRTGLCSTWIVAGSLALMLACAARLSSEPADTPPPVASASEASAAVASQALARTAADLPKADGGQQPTRAQRDRGLPPQPPANPATAAAGSVEQDPSSLSPERPPVIEPTPIAVNQCEGFEVLIQARGQRKYKRVRHPWTVADQARFSALIEMVAEEMGADPRLFQLWAMRESSLNPYAVHVLGGDRKAAERSWLRHRFAARQVKRLRRIVARTTRHDSEHWQAKRKLQVLTRFEGNPYYEDEVDYRIVRRGGRISMAKRSAWGFGYGAFGFNPALFLANWDSSAPPWVFCRDQGIAAIVTAIWAARKGRAECQKKGFGTSYEVVNRRFGSGHCRARPGKDAEFRRRARNHGIAFRRRARLGERWPQASSDRDALLRHLLSMADARGLRAPVPGSDQADVETVIADASPVASASAAPETVPPAESESESQRRPAHVPPLATDMAQRVRGP